MRTRRSKKSFEMAPPSRRNRGGGVIRRRALNIVNETIVLSDSDTEEENLLVPDDDDDDIQVIDVAEESDIMPKTNEAVSADGERNAEIDLQSENVQVEPPVINIEDEPDQNDDDGVEVLAVLVSSASKSRSAINREKRLSRKRKSISSNNGNLSQMQESIKKAKHLVRRSSSISSKNSDLFRGPLNKISANSKRIGKAKKWKNKFQGGNFQGGNFQGRKGHGLFQNRTREFERQIIFRTGNNADPNNIFNVPQSNYSFEVNPFLPVNASTPAFNRNRNNNNDRGAPWMPRRRAYNPPQIAPGSNIMNAGQTIQRAKGTLRPIVIDGSNIAVGHGGMLGGNREFSARGIRICVDYFKKRGHNEIVAFVPRFRLKKTECRDPELLEEMEREGHVRFTPSREAGGQRIASYDDLFVVEYAHETGGIVISNDNFKDLYLKKVHLQDTIKFRLLQYTWITQDVIMFPEDPLGRNGPSLDEFLRF